jgi:hypothetical protein
MTESPIRLSPSGPIIGKGGGSPGPGARLRLTEATSTMGGTLDIPTVPDVIGPEGFGAPAALVLTLDTPKEALQYRANLALDVANTATNQGGEVILYLDLSVDGGTTYTNRAKNAHIVNASITDVEARQMQVWLPLTLGSVLGVSDAAHPPSIKLRARAQRVLGTSDVAVNSFSTSDGTPPVTGLNGTIHMELEECL